MKTEDKEFALPYERIGKTITFEKERQGGEVEAGQHDERFTFNDIFPKL